MARKRTENRSIISTEGGASAAPVTRRRTSHVRVAQHGEAPAAEESVARAGEEQTESLTPLNDTEEIAKLAYALWEARGGQGGSPEEDWLRAEEEHRRRREESVR